jgi:hypothetical protein
MGAEPDYNRGEKKSQKAEKAADEARAAASGIRETEVARRTSATGEPPSLNRG